MIRTHRHICPRNCYDTCSIISTTRNGVLLSIEGDPNHEYTRGKLCAKVLEDVRKVYSPLRIHYPMRQRRRFSGYWERITWEEALDLIAGRILKLKAQYGTKSIALNKYSGNFGVLHNAIEGLFSGIGSTTRAQGSPCWSAGLDAQAFDFGKPLCSDPLDMAKSKLIWLWGINPAWTAVHQMPVIFKAMEQGARVICFDTHLSATAARCHRFVPVRPATDGLLALALAKVLVEEGLEDTSIERYSVGYDEFSEYLHNEIKLEDAAAVTGVEVSTMRELAREYGQIHPACIWAGFGLQRYSNGGQNLRAIDALAAIGGHLVEKGGGVQYAHSHTWCFSGLVQNSGCSATNSDRLLNINRFAQEALACKDPPVKMLWIAGRNPLSQDCDLNLWRQLIEQLDFVLISDMYLSKSAEAADIFLPVTTHYEHWDLHASYWHYWVGVNEPAILPVGEARSDLNIAWSVSERLKRLDPGSCEYPTHGCEQDTLLRELGPAILQVLGLERPEEILSGQVRAKLPSSGTRKLQFATPSGLFEFVSSEARKAGFPALPIYIPALEPSFKEPLRLLTPHHESTINSQTYGPEIKDRVVHINPRVAAERRLQDGDRAEIFNELGAVEAVCQIDVGIPPGILVIYQTGAALEGPSINNLLKARQTDMGCYSTGMPGLALNENFVNIRQLDVGKVIDHAKTNGLLT